MTVEEQCLFSRISVPATDDGGSPPGPNIDRVFLQSCITAAREHVEYITKQAMISQRWLLVFNGFPGSEDRYRYEFIGSIVPGLPFYYPDRFPQEDSIELLRRPVQEEDEGGGSPPIWSALTVKYLDVNGDEQTFDDSNYVVFANNITLLPNKCWPTTAAMRDCVRIEYPVGYGDAATDVPERLKVATKYLAGHFYDVRNPVSTEITVPVQNTLNALLGAFMTYRIPS